MKKLTLNLLTTAVVLASSCALASPSACPQANLVKPTIFTRAIEYKGLWILTSDAFSSDNQDWNVGALVPIKDVSSPSDALAKGQAYFNNASILMIQPKPTHYGRITTCKYTEDGREDYQVYALNPPQYGIAMMSVAR